jgi:hypothetical protein
MPDRTVTVTLGEAEYLDLERIIIDGYQEIDPLSTSLGWSVRIISQ